MSLESNPSRTFSLQITVMKIVLSLYRLNLDGKILMRVIPVVLIQYATIKQSVNTQYVARNV